MTVAFSASRVRSSRFDAVALNPQPLPPRYASKQFSLDLLGQYRTAKTFIVIGH